MTDRERYVPPKLPFHITYDLDGALYGDGGGFTPKNPENAATEIVEIESPQEAPLPDKSVGARIKKLLAEVMNF